ncbi:hypothetical protein [Nocardia testacea]
MSNIPPGGTGRNESARALAPDFPKGKIVEHWDVVQPVPDPTAIPHGMF